MSFPTCRIGDCCTGKEQLALAQTIDTVDADKRWGYEILFGTTEFWTWFPIRGMGVPFLYDSEKENVRQRKNMK